LLRGDWTKQSEKGYYAQKGGDNLKIYANLDAFYDENPERRRSGEADYGVHWTEPSNRYSRCRVSYVQKTGEVYAIDLPSGKVELLGIVPPDNDRIYYRTLDHILEGWESVIFEEGSLNWVREKLRRR
jgi:hypothetical protein